MSEIPYGWQAAWPTHRFHRHLASELVDALRRGESRLLYGGRGMGKSVLIREIAESFRGLGLPVAHVTHVTQGGHPRSEGLARAILNGLPGAPSESNLRRALLDLNADHLPLALLIDEFDAWDPQEARDVLDLIGTLSRDELSGRLGVLVAGGVGAFRLSNNPAGSPFASRINRTHFLEPLSLNALIDWAQPLMKHAPRHDTDWLGALHVASGGMPLLLAAAMQAAWSIAEAPFDPVDWMARFLREQDGFRNAVCDSVQIDDPNRPSARLLGLIHTAGGTVSIAQIAALGLTAHAAERQIRLFGAAALVSPGFDLEADPWWVQPQLSLLRIHGAPPRPSALAELSDAVHYAVRELARHAVDLWQGSAKANARDLVTEATLSAVVAVYLRGCGFTTEREAQLGPGRVDLLVRAPRVAGEAVIEVKIWGRNDYRQIEAQAMAYARETTEAIYTLMVASSLVAAETYADKVLGDPTLAPTLLAGEVTSWQRSVARADGETIPATHLLVCLARR